MSDKMKDLLEASQDQPAPTDVRTLHPEIDFDDPKNRPSDEFLTKEGLGLLLDPHISTFVQMILDDTEKNFEERLRKASEATSIDMNTPGVKEAIHHELSFVRYNNKAQLLFTKQVMLWNINKKSLEETLDVDGKNDVDIRNKISDLQDKLEEKIAQLYLEISKDKAIQDVVKEQVKLTLTPEQRIKAKRK